MIKRVYSKILCKKTGLTLLDGKPFSGISYDVHWNDWTQQLYEDGLLQKECFDWLDQKSEKMLLESVDQITDIYFEKNGLPFNGTLLDFDDGEVWEIQVKEGYTYQERSWFKDGSVSVEYLKTEQGSTYKEYYNNHKLKRASYTSKEKNYLWGIGYDLDSKVENLHISKNIPESKDYVLDTFAKEIGLSGKKIDDSFITKLKNKEFKRLSLQETSITDNSIEVILSIKGLCELMLYHNNNLSIEAVEKFKSKLNSKITFYYLE